MKTVLRALAFVVLTSGCSSSVAPALTPMSLEVSSTFISGNLDENLDAMVGSTILYVAWARLPNGSRQDVTNLASWQSLNTSVATVSPTGLVQLTGPGVTSLIVTYLGLTITTPVAAT